MAGLSSLALLAATASGSVGDDDFYAYKPASVACVIEAARRQRVPANILLAIATIESGRNGQRVTNKNGTQDIGHFQINSIHWRGDLAVVAQEDAAWRGCYNAELAAWILHRHLADPAEPDYWTRAANYHSRTPRFNAIYRGKLVPLAQRWGEWLRAHHRDLPVRYETGPATTAVTAAVAASTKPQ
ncbi:transglycosylase SLT domain-containing protein [Tahibacter amnicola]|uniref:Transglycosylase SLT domain-containing protein n=1 Tax=Tahibacter amnicola TaxID=2976241 RepID=A0ABY6BEW8_9GAMM|nr:transglycosylase SLT domain-containing protein [Tahibacter amnicola]UXI68327.1 transglycosylase SLT domain-containing protein [Tahibacter amnicola]